MKLQRLSKCNQSNNNIDRQVQNNVTNLYSKALDSTELNLLSKCHSQNINSYFR